MCISRKDRLKFKDLFKNEDKITLKQIYERAKIINPLYKDTEYESFISDFLNCGDCFFSSYTSYLKFMRRYN